MQDVAQVSLASILLREGRLEDTTVVIKKALEVRKTSFSWTLSVLTTNLELHRVLNFPFAMKTFQCNLSLKFDAPLL